MPTPKTAEFHPPQLTLRNHKLSFWEAESEGRGTRHHSPKAPTKWEAAVLRSVTEYALATARGKRVKPLAELSGWMLEQTRTPRHHPKGKPHWLWSQRMSVRLGSLEGVTAVTPKANASL